MPDPRPDGPDVHPTAIVHPGARLGRGVRVGPFCVIGEHVEVGDGTALGPHVVLDGWTRLGKQNDVGPGAVIGAPPQDKKYAGTRGYVVIGDKNVLREYVTVHRAADQDGTTRIGNGNFIMAFAHVAHNCTVGNSTIITNSIGLAGHITIEDFANLGGMTAYHQHVRIGAYAIVGGGLVVRMDVVPYAMAGGDPLRIYGLNREGLKRNGFTAEQMRLIKAAYRILFWSGLNTTDALVRLKAELGTKEEIVRLIRFVEGTKRGLTPGLHVDTGGDRQPAGGGGRSADEG